jgi:hypothetical protein
MAALDEDDQPGDMPGVIKLLNSMGFETLQLVLDAQFFALQFGDDGRVGLRPMGLGFELSIDRSMALG